MCKKADEAIEKSIALNLENGEKFNEETIELMNLYVSNEISLDTLVNKSISSLINGGK